MHYSHLAAFLTLLLKSFGEVALHEATQFQEECCGQGNLTAGVRFWGLAAMRRDATWLVAAMFPQTLLESRVRAQRLR